MPRPDELPRPAGEADPLTWLLDRDEYPKVLIWDRDRDEWAAGAGAADAIVAPDGATTGEVERALAARAAAESDDDPGWIGGLRFTPARAASATWRAFGAGFWIRPRSWWTRRDGVDHTGSCAERIELTPPDCVELNGEEPEVYVERVRAALSELEGSELEKIVVSRCVQRAGGIDVGTTLRKMAHNEPGGTVYWIALDAEQGFLGATPETLYRRRGVGVETEALAATSGPEQAAGAALLADDKSRREHNYVRDAIIDALRPVADSIDAATVPELHRMARLQHLRTPIRARLRHGSPLLSRLHPTPAVCGTPYAAAEAAIARLERHDRGLYAGAVGWFHRDCESIYVALRGARYSRDACVAFLGAGVVRGSVPELELQELDLKAQALFASLAPAASGVTR